MPPVNLVRATVSASPLPKMAVHVAVVRKGVRGEGYFRVIRWCKEPKTERRFQGITIDPEEMLDLSEVELAFEEPGRVVVVPVGYKADELTDFISRARTAGVEVVIPSQDTDFASHTPPFSPGRIAVGRSEPEVLLRMAVLRLYMSQSVVFQQLSPARLPEYFSLRYRVWEEIWKEMECDPQLVENDVGWEVNYSDLAALPVGAVAKETGELIACARLVRATGQESPYADDIRRLVRGSDVLRQRVDINGYELPFDMFEPFPGFLAYYHALMRQRVVNAEVSRVIVAPGWRNGGLGEVLLDHLVEFARERAVERLFLACQEMHEGFYERCGFTRIPGLESQHFGNLDVRAIAMHRDLSA